MDWGNLIYQIAAMIVSAAFTVGAGFLIRWLNSKKKQTDIENEVDINNNLINTIIDIITNVVVMLNQTIVDGLKASNSFSEAAAAGIFNQAKTLIMKSISTDMKEAVKKVYNMDIESFIILQIEKAVAENK